MNRKLGLTIVVLFFICLVGGRIYTYNAGIASNLPKQDVQESTPTDNISPKPINFDTVKSYWLLFPSRK